MPQYLLGKRGTSRLSRFLAKTMDALVALTSYFLGAAVWVPLGVVLSIAYVLLAEGAGRGQSLGKRIVNIEVRHRTGGVCGYRASILRNLPLALLLFCATFPGLWIVALCLAVPWIGFEIYLVASLPSGIRLGDIFGHTFVQDASEK